MMSMNLCKCVYLFRSKLLISRLISAFLTAPNRQVLGFMYFLPELILFLFSVYFHCRQTNFGGILMLRNYLHCVSKKTLPFYFYDNFVTCQPIFIILSLADSSGNLQ